MTETSALAELAETISGERELLTQGLAKVTELVWGPNGYQYSVIMEDGDGGQVAWLFQNSPTTTYGPPVVGKRWNGYLYQRNDWTVLHTARSYQAEAVAAQASIREAQEAETGLASLTSEDLDALMELPTLLDQNVAALRTARDYFGEASQALTERKQRVINSAWDDDGSAAYQASIDVQIAEFEACRADTDTLDEANVSLAQAAIDVYDALAQIYVDEMKEAGAMIDTLISLPKDVMSWQSWTSKLSTLMVDAMTRHATDFQAKVRELGDRVEAERIVAKAEEISRWESWPSPTGEALSG